MSTDALPVPDQSMVFRAADQPSYALSPTNRFAFPFSGHAGHPEVYLERAGAGSGPPVHRHAWATWELVLDGRVRFRLGDEDFLLEAGDAIYTPPHVVHGYVVESETAQIVGINSAGSQLEKLQRGAEPIFAAPGPPDMAAITSLAQQVGVELMGPPLAAASED